MFATDSRTASDETPVRQARFVPGLVPLICAAFLLLLMNVVVALGSRGRLTPGPVLGTVISLLWTLYLTAVPLVGLFTVAAALLRARRHAIRRRTAAILIGSAAVVTIFWVWSLTSSVPWIKS